MADVAELFGTLKGEFLSENNIAANLLTDFVGSRAGHADFYFKPFDEESVQGALKIAYEHKIPVTVRGAGTNLVGSTV
ncbi:MAG TPA: hypothetical protein DCR21_00105, partial [Succinivibrionaceae bacterium]|nr:hypothetical protein [Succinivibrionaceae bacterium]